MRPLVGVDLIQAIVFPPCHAVGQLERNVLLDRFDGDVVDLDVGRRVRRCGITTLEGLGDTDDCPVELIVPLFWRVRLHRLEEIHGGRQDFVFDLDQAHCLVADVLRVGQHDRHRRAHHEQLFWEQQPIRRSTAQLDALVGARHVEAMQHQRYARELLGVR